MSLNIIAQQTNSSLKSGANGLELESVQMVVIFQDNDGKNYFSGQVTLTAEDDKISFQSSLSDFKTLAVNKAKTLIADAQVETSESTTEATTNE